jgi:hypothetical protein
MINIVLFLFYPADELERGLCEWCLEYKEGRGDKYEE